MDINYLAFQIKCCNVGVKVDYSIVSMLVYSADIILLVERKRVVVNVVADWWQTRTKH